MHSKTKTRTHSQKLWIAAATTCALLALSACGKAGDAASSVSAAASAVGDKVKSAASNVDTGQATSAKLNGYTQGYNKLIGTFGLPETHERYLKLNIPKRKATENLSISAGWVDISLEQLKKARALSASELGALDQSADVLIGDLGKLVTQLKALEVYYSSKAYQEDDLAKGKAQDAEVRTAFDKSTASMKSFSAVLGTEEKKRSAAMLAKLKASGDMLGYNTKLGLQQAEEVVSLFDSEADIRDPAKYQAGDAIVASLDKTLAEQRELYAAAKDKEPRPDSAHESTGSSLVSFIGTYRTMKQAKTAKSFNDMVKKYNDAVTSANRLRS